GLARRPELRATRSLMLEPPHAPGVVIDADRRGRREVGEPREQRGRQAPLAEPLVVGPVARVPGPGAARRAEGPHRLLDDATQQLGDAPVGAVGILEADLA